jgi:hypothetical protein
LPPARGAPRAGARPNTLLRRRSTRLRGRGLARALGFSDGWRPAAQPVGVAAAASSRAGTAKVSEAQ